MGRAGGPRTRTSFVLLALLGTSVLRAQEHSSLARSLEDACLEAAEQVLHFGGDLAESRGVDLGAVRARFEARLRTVRTPADPQRLFVELGTLLLDPDAECVRPGFEVHAAKPPRWIDLEYRGPGLFLGRVGAQVFVEGSFGSALRAGVPAGAEVIALDRQPPLLWLHRREEAFRDHFGLGTGGLAAALALHQGLADLPSRSLVLDYAVDGVEKRVSLGRSEARTAPDPSLGAPPGTLAVGDALHYCVLSKGIAWIQLHSFSVESLPALGEVLLRIGPLRGLCLDLRGCDHGAGDELRLLRRFVREGQPTNLAGLSVPPAEGRAWHDGALVVLVDGTTQGAAETFAALLQATGRAKLVGNSETAGRASYHREVPVGESCRFSFSHRSWPWPLSSGPDFGPVVPDESVSSRPGSEPGTDPDPVRRRARELLDVELAPRR